MELVDRELAEHGVNQAGPGFYRRCEPCGATTLRFVPLKLEADRFTLVGIAEISTVFAGERVPAFTPLQMARLNARSVFGAFRHKDQALSLTAQYSIYAEEPAAQMAAVFIVGAFNHQMALGYHAAYCAATPERLGESILHLGYPRVWRKSVPQSAFKEAATLLSERGYPCCATPSGLGLGLPMSERPAQGSQPPERAALIHVTTNVVHPIAGVGYLATIALPVYRSREIVQVTSTLNGAELQQQDFMPRFGAWGLRGTRQQLVYSSFFPIAERFGDLHQTIVLWMIQRAFWIRSEFWTHDGGLTLTSARDSQ